MSQKIDRRAQIVQAARQLLATGGWEAVSVRAVAATAGIGASTLRHYFPTQRELLHTVLLSELEPQIQDFRITDSSVPPLTRLMECLQQFFPTQAQEKLALEAWFNVLLKAHGPEQNTHTKEVFELFTDYGKQRIKHWLKQVTDEAFHCLLCPDEFADFVTALANGLTLSLIADPTQSLDSVNHIYQDAIARCFTTHPPKP